MNLKNICVSSGAKKNMTSKITSEKEMTTKQMELDEKL
jgi:hypothetical protein